MKKLIFCLVILFSVSTIAYAQVIPGVPQMDRAFIILQGMEPSPYWCAAYYHYFTSGDGIGNQTDSDPNIQFISVTMKKKNVIAICKFTDEAMPYETNAEVGDIIVDTDVYGCTFQINNIWNPQTGEWNASCVCSNGTGHITAAANLGACDDNNCYGGTAMLKCTFDRNQCNSFCN